MKFIFSFFLGQFWPAGSGSTDSYESEYNLDPDPKYRYRVQPVHLYINQCFGPGFTPCAWYFAEYGYVSVEKKSFFIFSKVQFIFLLRLQRRPSKFKEKSGPPARTFISFFTFRGNYSFPGGWIRIHAPITTIEELL
jgi:hypothetical protein